MKKYFVLFLCFLFFAMILNAQEKRKKILSSKKVNEISISIRHNSNCGGLDVRSQSCPKDIIDFRTCEGVISGSNTIGALFQVQLPTKFGNGNKSWEEEGNRWSYSWPYPEGITVRVVVEPEFDGLKLSYTLENTSSLVLFLALS